MLFGLRAASVGADRTFGKALARAQGRVGPWEGSFVSSRAPRTAMSHDLQQPDTRRPTVPLLGPNFCPPPHPVHRPRGRGAQAHVLRSLGRRPTFCVRWICTGVRLRGAPHVASAAKAPGLTRVRALLSDDDLRRHISAFSIRVRGWGMEHVKCRGEMPSTVKTRAMPPSWLMSALFVGAEASCSSTVPSACFWGPCTGTGNGAASGLPCGAVRVRAAATSRIPCFCVHRCSDPLEPERCVPGSPMPRLRGQRGAGGAVVPNLDL